MFKPPFPWDPLSSLQTGEGAKGGFCGPRYDLERGQVLPDGAARGDEAGALQDAVGPLAVNIIIIAINMFIILS